MNNQIRNLVFGAGLAALLWTPTLLAQDIARAEIPFDFHVGKATLPSGTYAVSNNANAGTLMLRNEDSEHSIFALIGGRETDKGVARMTFRCYSGDCFLAAVWMPGTEGYSFSKSSREKEVEKGEARLAMAYVPLATR